MVQDQSLHTSDMTEDVEIKLNYGVFVAHFVVYVSYTIVTLTAENDHGLTLVQIEKFFGTF
jgi:hypothetical protein